jgi:hypothetical protein
LSAAVALSRFESVPCHAEGRGFESHHPLYEEPLVAAGKIRRARGNEFIFSDAPWELEQLPAGGRAPSHRSCNRQTMLHRKSAAVGAQGMVRAGA